MAVTPSDIVGTNAIGYLYRYKMYLHHKIFHLFSLGLSIRSVSLRLIEGNLFSTYVLKSLKLVFGDLYIEDFKSFLFRRATLTKTAST